METVNSPFVYILIFKPYVSILCLIACEIYTFVNCSI
jgi:hypothetical protein